MKDDVEWLNFRWGLDVSYTLQENAPLLTHLCKKYKRFWDGKYYYQLQSMVILRWPDWRIRYRVDMEKVRIRKHQSSKQKKLLPLLVLNMSDLPSKKEVS
jgi:hypothetical protein